jgi:glycosyltransferase involved in cell wall biosynthesis
MPKVSVIIPTYNSLEYLTSAIISAREQIYKDFEILVVDDCSTEDIRQATIAFGMDEIRYIRLPKNHGGPSRPRNIGIRHARGEYIAFFDSDDIMLPDRLSAPVTMLDSFPFLGMVCTNGVRFNDNRKVQPHLLLHDYDRFNALKSNQVATQWYLIDKKKAFNTLFFENFVITSSVTIRRSVFEEAGMFDETLTNADDLDMWFRIFERFDLGFIDSPTVKYRVRNGSISGRGYSLANNRIRVLRKRLDSDIDPVFCRQAHAMIALNYFGMGYALRCSGNLRAARDNYLNSLKEHFKWQTLFQLLVTFLGNDIIRSFQNLKARILGCRESGRAQP